MGLVIKVYLLGASVLLTIVALTNDTVHLNVGFGEQGLGCRVYLSSGLSGGLLHPRWPGPTLPRTPDQSQP